MLIDAHALIHRAFHALPPLTSRDGEPVGAVYGVASIFLKMITDLQPTHIVAAFDLPGATFRHEAYEDYKSHRPEAPDELITQFTLVQDMFRAFDVPVCTVEGFEADDVIGALAKKFAKTKNARVIIASGDHDTLQLVDDDRVLVYTMRKGFQDTVLYNEKAVVERYGFLPKQLPDFKGLKGDPSDNIIGVKGVGDKTATQVIQEFGDLDELYKQLKKKGFERPGWMTPRIENLLREGEEEALFSRELARIRLDTKVEVSLKDATWDLTKAKVGGEEFFHKLHFPSLIERLRAQKDSEKKEIEKEESTNKIQKATAKDIAQITESDEVIIVYEGELLLCRDGQFVAIDKTQYEAVATALQKHTPTIKGHNIKQVLHALGAGAFSLTVDFDTEIADQLLQESPTAITLADIAKRFGMDARSWDRKWFEEIMSRLEKELSEKRIDKIFYGIEMPLISILAAMEHQGILLDKKALQTLQKTLQKEEGLIEKRIHKLAGRVFNIASPKQLSEILFDDLGLATKGIKKTTTSALSTASGELEKLKNEHEIIGEVLRYREITKLLSTYITTLPTLVGKDKRIHTTFNQIGAATGRFSSQDPNLQNIPIRHEEGVAIRRAFVAEKGNIFLAFDYSQIELRIIAALSGDETMKAIFDKREDVHTATAAAMYDIDQKEVTKEMRRQAKVVNFGIIYGMGSTALSQLLQISRAEATKHLEDYFHTFSGIATYIEQTKASAKVRGYVETFYGRRRYIPGIKGGAFRAVREAERMATNMPVQGTEADIVKRAMIALEREFAFTKQPSDIAMLLQVHDELLFEVSKKSKDAYILKIKQIMERAGDLSVPLVVDVREGLNWGDLE